MIAGALLGDFVKGPLRGNYDIDTERGIELHRKIDAYSASSEDIRIASQALAPELQRYAGIVTDVVFDFFLSRHWARFHPRPLGEFAQSIYRTIESDRGEWPDAARHFSDTLIDHDLLCQYGDWPTVDRVLRSIGSRLSRDNPLAEAATSIEPQLDLLEAGFLDFYPKAQRFTQAFIKQHI